VLELYDDSTAMVEFISLPPELGVDPIRLLASCA